MGRLNERSPHLPFIYTYRSVASLPPIETTTKRTADKDNALPAFLLSG
jgi:hypothetical protein